MEKIKNRHENYEILNLLGYRLSKFDNAFIKEFGFTTKTKFFNYFVEIGIVETGSVVKNRMDLFDPFSQIMDEKAGSKKAMLTYIGNY